MSSDQSDLDSYAQAYLLAFEAMYHFGTEESRGHTYWFGPVYHNLGMAAELCFKHFLHTNSGTFDRTHDLCALYAGVRKLLPDPISFERDLGEVAKQWCEPSGDLKTRLTTKEARVSYYVFWLQLSLLNQTYYRDQCSHSRFKTRYPTPTDMTYYPINCALIANGVRALLESEQYQR